MPESVRVALLARTGEARDQLRRALADFGAELVAEGDPAELDPGTVAAAQPTVVLVSLEPAIEDSLVRFDDVLATPGVEVMFDDAEVTRQLDGWDLARWARHLAAKLAGGDLLPPVPVHADAVPATDLALEPGAPPTPAEQMAGERLEDYAAESLDLSEWVPSTPSLAAADVDTPAPDAPAAADAGADDLSLDLDLADLEAALGRADAPAPESAGRLPDDLGTLSLDDAGFDPGPIDLAAVGQAAAPPPLEANTGLPDVDHLQDALPTPDTLEPLPVAADDELLTLLDDPQDDATVDADFTLADMDEPVAAASVDATFDTLSLDDDASALSLADDTSLSLVDDTPLSLSGSDTLSLDDDTSTLSLAGDTSLSLGDDASLERSLADDTPPASAPRADEPLLADLELADGPVSFSSFGSGDDHAPVDGMDDDVAALAAQLEAFEANDRREAPREPDFLSRAAVMPEPVAAPAPAGDAAAPKAGGSSLFGSLELVPMDADVPAPVVADVPKSAPLTTAAGELGRSLSLAGEEATGNNQTVTGALFVLAGLGGPDGVRQLLSALPPTLPVPVLLYQHLDTGKHDRLVGQLAKASRLPLDLAVDGKLAFPGRVSVLQPGVGVVFRDDNFTFVTGADLASVVAALPPTDSTVLLLSGADPSVLPAVAALQAAGGRVLVQDPSTCFDAAAAQSALDAGAAMAPPPGLAPLVLERWH